MNTGKENEFQQTPKRVQLTENKVTKDRDLKE